MATDPSGTDELAFDGTPFIRVYKDGRVERLMGTTAVPPSVDPATGVTSKDVVVDPVTGVWVRLYLPPPLDDHDNKPKLPVLVYFHGGAFCIESASSPTYHNYLNALVARAHVVAVSVEYRRAPEHPLPAAYDDSWAALRWVASHAAGSGPAEPWLAEHGDFNHVFLAGDSAGANIAHNMVMRAAGEGLPQGVGIEGAVLTHPYFQIGPPAEVSEAGDHAADSAEARAKGEQMWKLLYPSSARGLGEPCVDPTAEGAPSMAALACRRVLVCVAEKDFLSEFGRRYCGALRGSGFSGELEMLESEGEDHVFHLLKPSCEKAVEKMERVAAFLLKGAAAATVPEN